MHPFLGLLTTYPTYAGRKIAIPPEWHCNLCSLNVRFYFVRVRPFLVDDSKNCAAMSHGEVVLINSQHWMGEIEMATKVPAAKALKANEKSKKTKTEVTRSEGPYLIVSFTKETKGERSFANARTGCYMPVCPDKIHERGAIFNVALKSTENSAINALKKLPPGTSGVAIHLIKGTSPKPK